VRDTVALPVNRLATPPAFFNGTGTQIGLTVLDIVNTRSSLLGATRVIDDIALDKYTFVRDAYLQRRGSLVFDSDPVKAPGGPDAGASEAGRPTEAADLPSAAAPASTPASTPAR
jgi:phospholipid-binding lipoprotein MlaA